MKSVLLLTLILSSVVAPVLFSRDPSAMRGLKRMILFFTLFIPVYYLYVAFVHTAVFVPQR